jgi:rhodanese-related sulfurtransferase
MFSLLMGFKTISPGDLQQLVRDKPVTIVDVNSSQSWLRAHVPGAVNLDSANYTESDLPADKQSRLVFYCSNPMCRKAPNAARRAKKMGYENTRVMSAGITGWLARELPTEPGQ